MTERPTPKRGMRRRNKVIVGAVAVFVGLAVLGSFLPDRPITEGTGGDTTPAASTAAVTDTPRSSDPAQTSAAALGTTKPTDVAEPSEAAQPTEAAAATAEPTTETEPGETFVAFGDGTWEVGVDIDPGTYRMRSPASFCYWARLSGFSGDLSEIIANGNEFDSQAIVTIGKNDVGFESQGCDEWSADLSRVTDSKTEFGNGTFLVKTDIDPGKYRNSGGESCYWARLKGFSGQLSHILANDNVFGGSTIVTINSTDKGFQSSGCGTWSKR